MSAGRDIVKQAQSRLADKTDIIGAAARL